MRLGFLLLSRRVSLRGHHSPLPSFVKSNQHRCRAYARKSVKREDLMAAIVNKSAHAFDKARLEALLNRRFFYAPAFEIYGGELLEDFVY